MKAKAFEEVILYRLRQEEAAGHASAGRYGVQGSFRDGKWQPLRSLPDFEGVLPPRARHFIFEAKVCGSASFNLHDDKFKARQYKHLATRARFGAVCFLLIHFSERKLKRSTQEAQTWAFPVHPSHHFWESFERGETKSISRQDCEEYAVRVVWDVLDRGRTPRPNILAAVYELIGRLEG